MPLITDPDQLNQTTEVVIDPSGKTIQLVVAGNLDASGVTLQTLYSFLKEEWKTDANLIKYAFPMQAITEEKFEMINTWHFADTTTRQLIRTGGWATIGTSGVPEDEYAGIVSLGSIGATDQGYYLQSASGVATNIIRQGVVNQAVKIYGNATHGNFDYRGTFNLLAREYAKTYAAADLSDIGVSTMTYQVYRFPLTNAVDLKIQTIDANVDTLAPYTGMSIKWYVAPQSRTIGGVPYNFHVIIDGNNGTAEQIYTFVQRQLRKTTDIDGNLGGHIGNITNELLRFTGENLATLLDSTGGVYIDNFLSVDTNRLSFKDDLGATITFPYVAVLTILFGDNLVSDPSGIFRVFFSNDDAGDNTGRDFGTSGAMICNTNDGSPMSAGISGLSSVSYTYDYDGNIQRGAASAGTDVPITVVGIGLTTAQYVKASGVIAESTANSISLVSNLERNYVNV